MTTLALKQMFWLPAPTFKQGDIPSQVGKVHIVTGGYAGVGYELVKMLYAADATVYIAGRSASKAKVAIDKLQAESDAAGSSKKGRLEFLQIDFSDLTTIKPAVETFLKAESRLDVLTNNAAVMAPPPGSKSVQGHDLQWGTNCLGSFLFTKLLTPVLVSTAKVTPPVSNSHSVRVTFAASSGIDAAAPAAGIVWTQNPSTGLPEPAVTSPMETYSMTKVGNVYFASEFARRYPVESSGVITNAWNPGNLRSELQRHMSPVFDFIIGTILHPPIYGAYTELFAGWAPQPGMPENNARYIWPWGRFGTLRKGVAQGLKSEAQGGNGNAEKFWDWCERETAPFA